MATPTDHPGPCNATHPFLSYMDCPYRCRLNEGHSGEHRDYHPGGNGFLPSMVTWHDREGELVWLRLP